MIIFWVAVELTEMIQQENSSDGQAWTVKSVLFSKKKFKYNQGHKKNSIKKVLWIITANNDSGKTLFIGMISWPNFCEDPNAPKESYQY